MNLYEKNLKALRNIALKEALSKIKAAKHFKVITGKDPLDINLQDLRDHTLIYQNPMQELTQMMKLYNETYPLYPVLYFYGFGNGLLYKVLAQNENHLLFVIFESEIEIFYHIFHFVDFTKELEKGKLIFLNPKDDLNLDAQTLFSEFMPAFYSSKVYFLELHSKYYEKFKENVKQTNEILTLTIKNTISAYGDDPYDALLGIKQHSFNLVEMISHPTIQELHAKRKGKFKSCVIVSTGPSLTKQLPLLKEVQERVVIFAADSAYPILMQNDIVPDYVCMVERTDFTAEFFKHDFGNKDDKTTFLLASLVHPNAIEYLEKRGRNYILIPKRLNFAQYVDLKAFALLSSAASVAHMALALALELEFKELVFIGQDLAYDDVGHSHPKDYQHSANFESECYEKAEILAYGGEGFVESHEIWIFFRQILEDLVKYVVNAKIYNATEGGARIEGMIEKPFSECCKDFGENKQNLEKLQPLSEDKQKEYALKAYAKVKKAFKECVGFQAMLRAYYEDIEPEFLKLNTLDLEEGLSVSFSLMLKVDQFRDEFGAISSVFYELIHAFFVHFCMNLNKILVLNPLTKEDLFNKNVLYIKEHLDFMQSIFGFVKAQEETLKFAITPLENALKAKGLSKYIERLS